MTLTLRRALSAGGFALMLPLLSACADNKPAPMVSAPVAPPALSSADASFVQTAAQGGMTEVQLGQLAQTKTRSVAVKNYAAEMVTDHTQNLAMLKQAVATKGITLPANVSDAQQTMETQLQGETGRVFDHDYIADMIAGHQALLTAYQAEAQNGTDADVKAYAAATIPAIQQHLAAAQQLQMHMAAHMAHHHHHVAATPSTTN